jgi:hypothetical protein
MRSDEEYSYMYNQIMRNRLPRTRIPTDYEMQQQGIAAMKEVRLAIADDLNVDLDRVKGERDRLRLELRNEYDATNEEVERIASNIIEPGDMTNP